jgi:hypothetical protein
MSVHVTVRLKAAALAALVALASGSCGDGPKAAPTAPAPIVPQATPTPPVTGGGPSASSCPIGKGDPEAACARGGAQLEGSINAAIDALIRVRPAIFDLREEAVPGTGTFRVLDRDAFIDGVAEQLRAQGLCAERSIDFERLVAKATNDSSEEWDVLTASGFIRRNGHRHTCKPASFPVDPQDHIAYVQTSFWWFDCDGIAPPHPIEGVLPLPCDGRVTATPKFRDGSKVPARIHGPDVTWTLREGTDIVELELDPRFPDPFNRVLKTKGRLGGFYLCAEVYGVEGCFHSRTVP